MSRQERQIAFSPGLLHWSPHVGTAAVGAAFALAVLLAVREIAGIDIGYHLAYGEHFLQTGRIVQTNQFIYTRLDPVTLADPSNLGPGNSFDAATHTYRFVNANWLSQTLMALVYRIGGVNGLVILQAALAGALFALLVAVLRQMGIGPPAASGAVLLAALICYERFNLRPEMFGYVVLLAQWLLLSRQSFAACHAVGVIVLQVVLVNMHSYFLPSIALAGAMLADPLLSIGWNRWVTKKPVEPDRQLRAKWLAVAAGGMIVACLANPWTWRGAILPLQTLAFLHEHRIMGGDDPAGQVHPWARVGELFSPFTARWAGQVSSRAYLVMLGLAGLAGVAGLIRRRWGLLLAMGGMLSLSLSLRRNMAVSAIVVIPCAAAILREAWGRLAGWLSQRKAQAQGERAPRDRRSGPAPPAGPMRPALPSILVSAAVLSACLALSYWTVTNKLYSYDQRSARFGTGWSRMVLPVTAAEWINRNNPSGRVYADYNVSSNLLFLTQPHRDMPILSNTWACPPYVMRDMFNMLSGGLDFDALAASDNVQVVVFAENNATGPLMRKLANSKDWAVVDLDAAYVTFVNRGGPNASLARAGEIRPDNLDVDRFAAKVASADPLPASALYSAALVFRNMGWDGPALAMLERCVAMPGDCAEARNMLGAALARRGGQKLWRMGESYSNNRMAEGDELKAQGLADLQRARSLFLEAVHLKSDYADAARNLSHAELQITDLSRGRIGLPGQN